MSAVMETLSTLNTGCNKEGVFVQYYHSGSTGKNGSEADEERLGKKLVRQVSIVKTHVKAESSNASENVQEELSSQEAECS